MAKGGQCLFEKVRRCIRTVFFVVALVVSLIVTSLPVVVAVVDILVPFVLISNFTCVKCYSFKEHFHRYSFKSSLMDIPLVSVLRSFIIICILSLSLSLSQFFVLFVWCWNLEGIVKFMLLSSNNKLVSFSNSS
jgi:hypothetical protein